MHTLELWLKGLVAAFIGGGANAVTVVLVDPEHFNVQEGIIALTNVIAVGALISVAGYLKSTPLPGHHAHPAKEQGGHAQAAT
jgi:hypothetical protein